MLLAGRSLLWSPVDTNRSACLNYAFSVSCRRKRNTTFPSLITVFHKYSLRYRLGTVIVSDIFGTWKGNVHVSVQFKEKKLGRHDNHFILSFLGEVAKWRKATLSLVMSYLCLSVYPSIHSSLRMSVCPPVYSSAWNNLAPIGRIFMKFDVWLFFEYLSTRLRFHWNPIRIKG